MVKEKFIFSTKNLDNRDKFVFSEQHSFDDNSSILNFIINDQSYDDELSDHLSQLFEADEQDLYNKIALRCEVSPSEIDKLALESEDDCKKAFCQESKLQRFSYFTCDNTNNNPDHNAFAVRCWRESSVGWINELIKDETLCKLEPDGILYLMMHDKDVPGYEGKSFEILTPEKINNIGGVLGQKENNKWVYNGFEVRIIIFNHVGNAIVDILKKSKLKEANIAQKVESIYNNQQVLKEKLFIKLEPSQRRDFSGLDEDGFVDVCDNVFEEESLTKNTKTLPSGCLRYDYVDVNGALLTELMHVKADLRSSNEFLKFLKALRRPALDSNDENKIVDVRKMKFPIIIKIYKSFFDDWEKSVDSEEGLNDNQKDKKKKKAEKKKKIRNHSNKMALEENLDKALSFFNNSSIFIRLVDINDTKAYDNAVAEFEYFDSIGLYDYDSAWENLEYNTRIQPQNYLESLESGHGNFVTPILYGDESKARVILKNNHVVMSTIIDGKAPEVEPPSSKKNEDGTKSKLKEIFYNIFTCIWKAIQDIISRIRKTFHNKDGNLVPAQTASSETQGIGTGKEFKHMEHFHDIALRILLIDDKVGGDPEGTDDCRKKERINIKKAAGKKFKIKKCDKCPKYKECKLHTIKRLMDDGKSGDEKGKIFDQIGETEQGKLKKDYFYWDEQNIECYYCPTIYIDFIDDEAEIPSNCEGINVYSDKKDKKSKKNLLDIHCDFKSSIDSSDRNHVQIVGVRDVRTALMLLSKYKFDLVFCDYLLDKTSDDSSDQREYANQLFEFLSQDHDKETQKLKAKLKHDVLDNRGPLGRLWIMPITGFNQTFIQDLYRNKINLIDYRWNICNGADPITTPWQFLYHLNKFIELQLRMCVYRKEQLLQFLMITCMDLKEMESKNGKISFDDFKSIMGSEYATFVQLYGNKLTIKRDAYIHGSSDDKSVFATDIWHHFYAKKDYYDVIELNRLAHRFYHQASTMHNDIEDRKSLNKAFGSLRFFLITNGEIRKAITDKNDLEPLFSDDVNVCGLGFLQKVIAQLSQVDEKS